MNSGKKKPLYFIFFNRTLPLFYMFILKQKKTLLYDAF